MKVIILCGGQGTRLREETEFKPKPMVEIGEKPILWHIMKIYANYGFNEFILALGYKGDVVRDYFLNYEIYNNDFTVVLGDHKKIKVHGNTDEAKWKITLVETGDNSMTGSRVRKCAKYINEESFMLTYGDGLADINIKELVKYHNDHKQIGTLTGVNPPSRFGEIVVKNTEVVSFIEKPKLGGTRGEINGGFMVFNRKFFNYLSDEENCILEKEPLENLANNGQLNVYHHEGFWQCMDTYRDHLVLNDIWNSEKKYWKIW